MRSRDFKIGIIAAGVFSVFLIGWGIYLIIEQKYTKGYDHYTQQVIGAGGEYFIFTGLIFGIVVYYSISPFSKFRKFFERKRRKNKKK